MKKWLTTLFIIVISLTAFKAEAQTITQTYIDPCDNKVYVVTIPFGQNQTIAIIRGKSKIVTLADMNNGTFQLWVNSVFAEPCPQNDAIRLAQEAAARAAADAAARAAADAAAKAAADAAAKAAASAASNAAGNAASSAASGAASNAASSAASGAASSAATTAAAPPPVVAAPPPPPPTSTPPPASSSSSTPPPANGSSSSSGGSSSSSSSSSSSESKSSGSTEQKQEQKTEQKQEQKQEEKKTESKQEEKKEESKSEEKKDEKKEESKEEKKDEKKEDKKEEKKKEEKKKSESTNPMLLASDITAAESADGKYLASITIGVSKASMAGDESYSGGLVVNSNLSSIVTTGGYTKMKFTDDGQLDGIHSYGTAFAYLSGNYMNLLGYTYIKPTPKRGTYGYNVGVINLFLKNDNTNKFEYNMASSAIVFWTKPYQYSRKLTISPQVFTMFSPISYNSVSGATTVNRHMGFLLGAAFDYKISKRFGFSFNYKLSGNTKPFSPFLSNFLIGSRMVL